MRPLRPEGLVEWAMRVVGLSTLLFVVGCAGTSQRDEDDLQETLLRMALRGADSTYTCFLALREGEGETPLVDPSPEIMQRLSDLPLEMLPASAARPHPDATLAKSGMIVGPGGRTGKRCIAWVRERLGRSRVRVEVGRSGGGLSGSSVEVIMVSKAGVWSIVKKISDSAG